MEENKSKTRQIVSAIWTIIKGLVVAAFIFAGGLYIAQNISSKPSNSSPTSSAQTDDAERTTLKVEYTSSVVCPPIGCMPAHSIKILNTGDEPVNVRRVILNRRDSNETCNIAVNKRLATGDVWDKPTEVFVGKSIDDECGTIVLVEVETDHGTLQYKFSPK